MKSLVIGLLIISSSAYSQDSSIKKPQENGVETIVKESKKERKKKVEMCHDCGKPEEQCDCKGHGKK